jgi:hypothetical protein
MNTKLGNLLFYPMFLCFFALTGCFTHQKASVSAESAAETGSLEKVSLGGKIGTQANEPVLIYKTRRNYNDHVPVLMDDQKTRILSYPDPTDLYYRGKISLPTRLKNGYLLDNRGIGKNVAFLTYTYEAYVNLKQAPDMKQLTDSLLDRNPLTELWQCGSRSRFSEEEKELNILIDKGFPGCKALVLTMTE